MAISISIYLLTLSISFGRNYSLATDLSQGLASRQLQNNGVPSIANFITRAYQSSIVLGDYLYIDGGEINFYDNGVPVHLPDNNTYSIDLTSSWTNQSVTFNQINKTAPVLNYVSLWKDASNTTFYAYGGEPSGISFGQPRVTPPNGLWQFTPQGKGGSWSEVGISSNSIFPSLISQAAAAGTSGNGAGYLLGGYNDYVPSPGIVTYNMSSGVWANNSAAGFSTYGTAQYGQMQYVADAAENGLLVLVGGETSNDVEWFDNGSNLLSFANIYMYNPGSNTWHNQTASGTIPASRDRFCSVGVQGDNGTFEIFIMGGHMASASGEPQASATEAEKQLNIALDEVFVLSLPSFNWQKADYTPASPQPSYGQFDRVTETPDIWANGIGIFDMSQMEWSDLYDAAASDYVTPKMVKDWIRQNGPYPSTWDDPTVKGYFTRSATSTNSTSSPYGTFSPNSSGICNSSTTSSSHTGAIAGGSIGGIAVLAFLGGVLWFVSRRRHRSRSWAHSPHSREHVLAKTELAGGYENDVPPVAEAKENRYQGVPQELPNTSVRHEMQG